MIPAASNGSSTPPVTGNVDSDVKKRSGQRVTMHQPVIQKRQRQPFGIGLQP